MKIETVKTSSVKINPANPRTIKDEKFAQLVRSIRDFPEMLNIRPIVVNAKMEVLGGNMRLRACIEAGMKEVQIIRADNLTDDKQREFIIKDNVGFGEWEWGALSSEWDKDELEEWGIDVSDIDVDQQTLSPKKIEIKPYEKTHILLSFPPHLLPDIESALEQVVNMYGVEYEQGSN